MTICKVSLYRISAKVAIRFHIYRYSHCWLHLPTFYLLYLSENTESSLFVPLHSAHIFGIYKIARERSITRDVLAPRVNVCTATQKMRRLCRLCSQDYRWLADKYYAIRWSAKLDKAPWKSPYDALIQMRANGALRVDWVAIKLCARDESDEKKCILPIDCRLCVRKFSRLHFCDAEYGFEILYSWLSAEVKCLHNKDGTLQYRK